MDYLKLVALALSPAIALYAILVTYKTKIRTGDPNAEKEVLTRGGMVALVLVVVAGLFNVISEWNSQRKKGEERGTEIRQVMEQLDRLQKGQDVLNRAAGQMQRKTDYGLLLLRQLQGDPAHRQQPSAPKPSAAPDVNRAPHDRRR
jgi:hypothetical protein